MRYIAVALGGFLLFSANSEAKHSPPVIIQVVDTVSNVKPTSIYLPGMPGTAKTTCNGTAVANGSSNEAVANGTENCTTTSTPVTGPRFLHSSVIEEYVRAKMPDGRHITLWCQKGNRRCDELLPGAYTAKIDGDTVWMSVPQLDGKLRKIKYHYVGNW